MAQRKAHEVDDWLKRQPAGAAIVLLYGPDRGLVSERAALVARQTGLALDDAFAVVRLEAGDLDGDPGRLIDEARTIPLFGGRRLIWVKHASNQKALAEAVRELAASAPQDAFILVEADDLKKTSPLRAAVENAETAMALPCYADEGRALDSLIDQVLGEAGLRIGAEARRTVKQRLGGDRLASRGELEKLALYAHGRGEVSVDDIELLSGDVAQSSLDGAIDRLLEGDAESFDRAFDKLAAAGSTFPLLAAALRQFQHLQLLRAAMDRGNISPAQAVGTARPPVFFSRRKTLEQALQRLDGERIAAILERLMATILQSRKSAGLSNTLTQRALSGVCLELARR